MDILPATLRQYADAGLDEFSRAIYAANDYEQSAISTITEPVKSVYHATVSAVGGAVDDTRYLFYLILFVALAYVINSFVGLKKIL